MAGCSSPPQVVQISPSRGATDVAADTPVSIQFDRPMDEASVESRFHLNPATPGRIRWPDGTRMIFDHVPLQPTVRYRVLLEAGYKDQSGQANPLRHSWQFTTQGPPTITSSTPGIGETGVDPSTYISLTFNRPMDLASLTGAISLEPSLGFRLQPDPADAGRVVLAPDALLEPGSAYRVIITAAARDASGGHLANGTVIPFQTGPLRGLQHWIGFVAQAPASGRGEAIWIVNESRFPRQLMAVPVAGFYWSPAGDRMLVRSEDGGWSDRLIDGTGTVLPFRATWAGYLAAPRGYAYLDGGHLRTMAPDGRSTSVADGVAAAAVNASGTRIAYAAGSGEGARIDVYDVDLRTSFVLAREAEPVDALDWAPDGQGVAYRVVAADPARSRIRARLLRGPATSVLVATGDVGPPQWQADSRHVLFTARVAGAAGPIAKAFSLAVGEAPPAELTAGLGIPGQGDVSVLELSPSPDGHEIAFISPSLGLPQVFLMNADGSAAGAVTRYGSAGYYYASSGVAWTQG